jgi:hypothetical protein
MRLTRVGEPAVYFLYEKNGKVSSGSLDAKFSLALFMCEPQIEKRSQKHFGKIIVAK